MNNKNCVNVNIEGQDYSPVAEASIVLGENQPEWNDMTRKVFQILESSVEQKQNMAGLFLDQTQERISSQEILVNSDGTKDNKKGGFQVWNRGFQGGYFGGIVGAVENNLFLKVEDGAILPADREELEKGEAAKLHIKLRIRSRFDAID